MKSLIQAALLSTLMLATHAAAAAAPVADDAIFLEGTRYSAVLSRSQGAWRLMPASGSDIHLRVSPDCGTGADLPRGLWLMTRDAAGQPQLVAPSATPLPPGHPGHVRLVDCDRPAPGSGPALALPPGLVQWLELRSGSIYVAR